MSYDDHAHLPTDDLPDAREAFVADDREIRDSPTYAVSRAAALLTAVRSRASEVPDTTLEQDVREDLGVPWVAPIQVGRDELFSLLSDVPGLPRAAAEVAGSPQVSWRALHDFVALLPDSDRFGEEPRAPEDLSFDVRREAARRLFTPGEGPSHEGGEREALQLAALSLVDRHALVRVAAAIAISRVERGNPLARAILAQASRNRSDEVGFLASAGQDADEDRRYGRGEAATAPNPSGTADSALVHGTWARDGHWWSPDGDFHAFLRDQKIFPKLYSGPDPFAWSGSYSLRARLFKGPVDWDRLQAGSHLAWWAERRLDNEPNVIGHSYGASIAMCATRVEKELRGLVLLSPAVHETCVPDPRYFQGALIVRMKHDLILLADRSNLAPLYNLANVQERILPRRGLTAHFGTHDPAVWAANGVAGYVRDQWLPSL